MRPMFKGLIRLAFYHPPRTLETLPSRMKLEAHLCYLPLGALGIGT